MSITTLHGVMHVESHRVIVTWASLKCHTSVIHAIFPMIYAASDLKERERCLPMHEAPPHAPLWLYATPAHALRDTYHASNYLTIAEGPGRIGSMVNSRLATVNVPAL